jgi:hypothetical protein
MARISVNKLLTVPLKGIREAWHRELVNMFLNYRILVPSTQTSPASTTQLALPDTLMTIPLLTNTTMKLPAFSLNRVTPDLRMYVAYLIKGITVTASQLLFYPRIYQLHDILDQSHQPGTLTTTQTIALPVLVPDVTESFQEAGVYLIYNGEILMLYAGQDADEGFLQDVSARQAFGVSRHDLSTWRPADLGTEESSRIMAIIDEIRRVAQKFVPIIVIPNEAKYMLRPLLVEDATPSEMAYNEYLFQLNRIIQTRLEAKS